MALIRNSFSSVLENFLNGSAALPLANGGTGATTASDARSNLGLGTISTQAASNVAITGGSVAVGTLTSTGALGYATGAGGTVTQTTSKSTGVTLNKRCGQITTSNAALGSGSRVAFTVTNSTISSTDVIHTNVQSGAAAPGSYAVYTCNVRDGSFDIAIHNFQGGSLSEAIVINFAALEGVTS